MHQLVLEPLAPEPARLLVAATATGGTMPEEVVEFIVRASEGVPLGSLVAEEMTFHFSIFSFWGRHTFGLTLWFGVLDSLVFQDDHFAPAAKTPPLSASGYRVYLSAE